MWFETFHMGSEFMKKANNWFPRVSTLVNMTSGLDGLQALQDLQVTTITLASLLLLVDSGVVTDALMWLVQQLGPWDVVSSKPLLLCLSSTTRKSVTRAGAPSGSLEHTSHNAPATGELCTHSS